MSLNAADPATYDELCRPTFAKAHRAVIRFARRCVEEGIATTLTAVEQPGVDLRDCEALAQAVGARFRARRLVPRPQRAASDGAMAGNGATASDEPTTSERGTGGDIEGEDPGR